MITTSCSIDPDDVSHILLIEGTIKIYFRSTLAPISFSNDRGGLTVQGLTDKINATRNPLPVNNRRIKE